MKTNISEDLPARKFAPAASVGGGSEADSGGSGDVEKKTRQLVYDSKYQVKKQMGPDTKMDPAAVVKAVLDRINKSEYPEPIKARARKIVMGDNQVKEMKEFASHNVARALYSVFVEQSSKIIDEEYIEKLKRELSEADQSPEERKYKVRVTDKETGNSYIRMANRSKINELRANPNIASVEMLDLYGSPEPTESERTKGAQTASVAAGKGLKNNDGNLANNYPPYNKVTRGDVIAGATGKDQMGGKKKVREEFIGEKDNGDEKKQIKPMKPGKKNNCVKVYDPSGSGRDSGSGRELMMHQELEGELIAETGYTKFLDMIQEKKLTKAEKAKKEQIVKSLKPKYGKTSKTYAIATSVAKRVAEEKEEKKSEESGCEDDSRAKYAEREVIKNRLRAALGIKNPIVMTAGYNPEGELVDEATRAAREGEPEPWRGVDLKRRREESQKSLRTPAGREELASKAASRRRKQTPEAQAQQRSEDENFERVKGINKRRRTKKEIKDYEGVRAAGPLGS